MKNLHQQAGIFQLIQTLSLDVVAGSLAVGFFAVRLLQVDVPKAWWFILPTAVWSLYTFDHLIDGMKQKGQTRLVRHRFHYRYRKPLAVLAVLSAALSAGLAGWFLTIPEIAGGILIGLVSAAYFLALHLFGKRHPRALQKELFIALIYVSGIWLVPLIRHGAALSTFHVLVLAVLFLLAWTEGVMASWFDHPLDTEDRHSSFAVLFGRQRTRHFLFVLFALTTLLIAAAAFFGAQCRQVLALSILSLMNLALLFPMLFPGWFARNERYRVLGETCFWLPVLLFFC